MSIKVLFGILFRNWLWLITIPVVTAVSIFFFTRKMNKEYATDTIIYTGINSSYNLKDENQTDYFASSKAFANLLTLFNSRATKQEVAFQLLARHLSLKDYDPSVLSWQTYVRLGELFDAPTRAKLVGASFEETVANITAMYHSNDTNTVYKILNGEETGYSLKALSKLSANQISNSDLMKVDYVSNDAAMCRQTLEILSAVFIRKHKELMEGQNESVIDYFQTATAKAAQRLELAEKKLLDFHRKNNILNFEEQVSNIAGQKQRQQQAYNDLELQYAGTLAALQEVERNLKRAGNTLPNSQEILKLRNQLSAYNTRITEYETFYRGKALPGSGGKLTTLKRQAEDTEEQLRQSLNAYSSKVNDPQNLPNKGLLDEWLKDAILAERMKGQLLVMRKQIDHFEKESDQVAPMGASLRKLQREKELAEKEYFNLLNGLTQSRLTQQNIELTSQLKVVDQPVTPSKPLSSKRIVMVLAGAVGTFVTLLAFLIGTEILDFSLKNPVQASRQTGLPVFGILPTFNSLKKQQEMQIKGKEDHLARKLLLK
ncbi:MAG: GumC family protein, partial [Adhaeribacter sp.]